MRRNEPADGEDPQNEVIGKGATPWNQLSLMRMARPQNTTRPSEYQAGGVIHMNFSGSVVGLEVVAHSEFIEP